MIDLKGIVPPVVTPLDKNEDIDETSLRKVVRYLLEGGVHGIFVLGSCGEFASLTDKAKRRAMEIVVEEAKGKVPVIAGTGDAGTRRVIENTKVAKEIGVDAAVLVPPYYFFTQGQGGIYEFYRKVVDTVDIPLVIYNNPHLTKLMIDLDTVERLSQDERVIAIKDSSSNFNHFQKLVFSLKDTLRIFQGDENFLAASFAVGAHGAVAGMANLVPKLCVEVYRAAQDKDWQKALNLQQELNQIIKPFEAGVHNFIPRLKYALELLGLCQSWATHPYLPLEDGEKKEIEEAVRKFVL